MVPLLDICALYNPTTSGLSTGLNHLGTSFQQLEYNQRPRMKTLILHCRLKLLPFLFSPDSSPNVLWRKLSAILGAILRGGLAGPNWDPKSLRLHCHMKKHGRLMPKFQRRQQRFLLIKAFQENLQCVNSEFERHNDFFV